MPRFFFDGCNDGRHVVDAEGVDLPSVEAARRLAAKTLAEVARDVFPDSLEHHIAIEVLDASRQTLLTTEMTFRTRILKLD